MPKIDRAHKSYLTPEIWGEMYLREIFYGTLIFQQSSMICIGRHHESQVKFPYIHESRYLLESFHESRD